MKKLQGTVDILKSEEEDLNGVAGILLEYYLVEEELVEYPHGFTGKSYGIEIIKKEYGYDNDIAMENSIVRDIFICEKKIKEFIEKLIYNRVTPITLNNVVEDMI
jgi:hypothetical protein